MRSPKAECEFLMNAALPFAEQMLLKHGEFFPYGSALTANGEIAGVGVYDGREQPPSKDGILLLKQAFQHGVKSGEYTATAPLYDVRIILPSSGKKSDAIAVSLNHQGDYSVIVMFPYEIKRGQLQFGEVFAQMGEADIFPPQVVHDISEYDPGRTGWSGQGNDLFSHGNSETYP
jgi:hypothetical protein